MEFFIFNDKFEVQAEIDTYTSLMWCRRAHDVGALDLQVEANEDNIKLFQIGYFIYRKDTNDICRIDSIEINTDNDEGDTLIVGATDLKSLAEQVTVIGQYKTQITQDGESKIIIENEVNVEEWIRESLKVFTPYESSTLSKAVYPNFTIDNFTLFDLQGHETTCVLNEGENLKLSEHINHLCKMGGFTWDIKYDYENKLLKSDLKKGLSKSINQNENTRILFSRNFDNLQSTKLSQTIDKMANVAVVKHNNASIVGDNGFVYAYFSKDEPYGIYRFDLLVDGTSVAIPHKQTDADYVEVEAGTGDYKKNDDGTYTKGKGNYNYEPQYTKDEITAYKEILKGLGISKLRENRAYQVFESEINFNSFEYRKDFDIGDIVTVQNEYGIELDAKIIEVVETWDESGYSIEPIFEFIDTGNNFEGFAGFGNFENTDDDWYYGDCLITEEGEPLMTEPDDFYLMYESVATILETEEGIALATEEGAAIATYVNRGISTYDAEPVSVASFNLTDNGVDASEIETIKISELPEATNIGDACCLPIVQDGTTKKIYFNKVKNNIAQSLSDDIDEIKSKIPSQATAENQLADKDFVNSSIATNTAYFIGTFNSLDELRNTDKTITVNDYAFVIEEDLGGESVYNRYKYDGSEWVFEYKLNNSSFTSEQWKAINSGVTDEWKNEVELKLNSGDPEDTLNPVQHFSFDELPDTLDAQNTFTYASARNTGTVEAIENGYRITANSYDPYFGFHTSIGSVGGFFFSYKVKGISKTGGVFTNEAFLFYTDGSHTSIDDYIVKPELDKEIRHTVWIPADSTKTINYVRLDLFTGADHSAVIDITDIYIGKNSYSFPLIDNSGNSHTRAPNALATKGISGKGLKFFEKTSPVPCKNVIEDKGSNFSFCLWVKGDPSRDGVIGSRTPGWSNGWGFAEDGIHYLNGDILVDYTATFSFPDDGLYHFVCGVYSDTKCTAYLDGQQVAEVEITPYKRQTSEAIYLGCMFDNGLSTFNGSIDDVLIFDKVLSEEEILTLYGLKGNTPKSYKFSEYVIADTVEATGRFYGNLIGEASVGNKLQAYHPEEGGNHYVKAVRHTQHSWAIRLYANYLDDSASDQNTIEVFASDRATCDKNGADIVATYATKAEFEELKKNSEELIEERDYWKNLYENSGGSSSGGSSSADHSNCVNKADYDALQSDYNSVVASRDSYKQQIENHVCSGDHSNCISRDAYNTLQNEYNSFKSNHSNCVSGSAHGAGKCVSKDSYDFEVESKEHWAAEAERLASELDALDFAYNDLVSDHLYLTDAYKKLEAEYNAFKAKHTKSSC